FNERMEDHARISDQGRKKVVISAVQGELPRTDDTPKYRGPVLQEKDHGWVVNHQVVTSGVLSEGQEAALLFGQTNFYAEQGGQLGDTGTVVTDTGVFAVTDTQKLGDAVLHVGRVRTGTIKVHQLAELTRSDVRLDTMRNHTATHLLNWALRQVLGEHVEQKGSLVDPDKTRFDFAHDRPLSPEQVAEVERLGNDEIL